MTSCPLTIMMGEWVQHVGPSTWVIWPKHTHTEMESRSRFYLHCSRCFFCKYCVREHTQSFVEERELVKK